MNLPIQKLMIITKNALRFTDEDRFQTISYPALVLCGLVGETVPPKFSVNIASFTPSSANQYWHLQ